MMRAVQNALRILSAFKTTHIQKNIVYFTWLCVVTTSWIDISLVCTQLLKNLHL